MECETVKGAQGAFIGWPLYSICMTVPFIHNTALWLEHSHGEAAVCLLQSFCADISGRMDTAVRPRACMQDWLGLEDSSDIRFACSETG